MKSIFVLTGAGISAESGIPTYLGADGLWGGQGILDIASVREFHENLRQYCNKLRRHVRANTLPNAAHFALAHLEREFLGGVTLVTQNIDDLHERAGSKNVIHIHGELVKARCRECRAPATWCEELDGTSVCPSCSAAGSMRPDVVLFGEMPLRMDHVYLSLAQADLFIAIGTSGTVYPGSGLAAAAVRHGIHAIEVNTVETAISGDFREYLRGNASMKVPQLVERILQSDETRHSHRGQKS